MTFLRSPMIIRLLRKERHLNLNLQLRLFLPISFLVRNTLRAHLDPKSSSISACGGVCLPPHSTPLVRACPSWAIKGALSAPTPSYGRHCRSLREPTFFLPNSLQTIWDTPLSSYSVLMSLACHIRGYEGLYCLYPIDIAKHSKTELR